MSLEEFKEVGQLRKTGKLQEALNMALDDYNQNADIWNARSLYWVYFEYLKDAAEQGNENSFFSYIDKIIELKILNEPEEELARINFFKCIKALFKKKSEGFNNQEKINQIAARVISIVDEITIQKPSMDYSELLDAFLPIAEKWDGFLTFVEQWDINNFREEDFKKRTIFNSKKTYMSLVENFYIAYTKVLLNDNANDKLRDLQPKLDQLADNPQMPFLGYFNAKVLLALNSNRDDVLEEVRPFVRRKINEYWAWQFLSEVFCDDEEKYLACLLRAVNCNTQEGFLPKIRLKLIDYYVKHNDFPRMKYHIERYVHYRLQNGYRVDSTVQNIINRHNLNSISEDGSAPIDYMTITNAIIGITNTDTENSDILKGIVTTNKAGTAFFVKGNDGRHAFIPPKLAQNLKSGQRVQAKIEKSYDHKRQQESFICITLKSLKQQ